MLEICSISIGIHAHHIAASLYNPDIMQCMHSAYIYAARYDDVQNEQKKTKENKAKREQKIMNCAAAKLWAFEHKSY